MNKRLLMMSAVASAVLAGMVSLVLGDDLGSEFTFQGQLKQAGSPYDGLADLEFSLWDADSDGSQIGSTIALSDVPVSEGVFTVELDFGVVAFDGSQRWVEIAVNGTTLTPRQKVNGTPYSIQTRGLFVTDASNVGIGTTTPGAKLGVIGDIRVSGKVQSSSGHLDLSGGGSGVNVLLDEDGGSNDAFVISDTGVERFRVDGNSGTVTAAAFVGDGSGLTDVNASQIASPTGMVRFGNGVELYTRPTLLDQEYEAFQFGTSGVNGWQSFTAGLSGDLAVIEVRRDAAVNNPASAAEVRIYGGEGTSGALLGTASIPAFYTAGWQAASLPSPIAIAAGNQYTIELVGTSQLWWLLDIPGTYDGGRSGEDASWDFAFRTFNLDASGELSRALVADSSGNVGIGTTEPTALLDVNGTAKATAFIGDGSGLTNLPVADDVWNANGTDIYYNAGKVGIGTDTPTENLDVHGVIVATNPGGTPDGSSVTLGSPAIEPGLVLVKGDGAGNQLRRWDLRYSTAQDSIVLYNKFANVTAWEALDNGNLGIGTSSPSNKLSVQGDADFANNVGIGTNAPTTNLDVRGEIAFGSDGSFAPPAYDRQTMMVAGRINQDGTIDTTVTSAGAIASSVQNSNGNYTITFANGTFALPPIITVTCEEASNGDRFRNAVILSVSTTSLVVQIKDKQGDDANAPFQFIAIGER